MLCDFLYVFLNVCVQTRWGQWSVLVFNKHFIAKYTEVSMVGDFIMLFYCFKIW